MLESTMLQDECRTQSFFTNSRCARIHHPPRSIQVLLLRLTIRGASPQSLPLSLSLPPPSPSLPLFLSPSLPLSPLPPPVPSFCSVHRDARRHSLFHARHERVHHPPRVMQIGCHQLKLHSKHPHDQPSELIPFPNLRIYFTDFPYLLCSMVQRLLNLEA